MRRSLLAGLVLGTICLGAGALLRPSDNGALLRRAQALMVASRFSEAVTVLDTIPAEPLADSTVLEARLLHVESLRRAGQAQASVTAARALHEALPRDHAARGRAQHLLADALAATGDVSTAAALHESLAAEVLGDEHKARVAGYYILLAEAAANGRKADDVLRADIAKDPASAASLYARALEVLTGGSPRASITLPQCRALIASSQGAQAANLLELLLKRTLPLKTEAEARLLRGEACLLSQRFADARGEARAVIAMESSVESGHAPLAWYLLAKTFLSDQGAVNDEALRAFDTLLTTWPSFEKASEVRVARATYLLTRGRLDESILAQQAVVEDTTASKSVRAEAAFLIGRAHEGLTQFDAAREAYRSFLAAYPDDRRVPEAQQRLPELLLAKARHLASRNEVEPAVSALTAFLDEYPLEPRAPSAAHDIGLVWRGAKEIAKAKAAFESARDRYRRHDPRAASGAAFMVGVLEEEDEKNLERAVATWRSVVAEFPGQPFAQLAAQRIAQLEQVELSLASERAYAPGETPKVRLVARNIKEVTLRVYGLNALDLFERHGDLARAADVEVGLVQADHQIPYAIPDWQRYARTDLEVPLTVGGVPLGEGTWLVSAETDERRALVMVIVSAVRVVVKESPFEVFCWAVDATSGQPLADVTLHVRGEDDYRKQIVTGKDGVARLVHDGARGLCRVLGIKGESVAPGEVVAPPMPGKAGLAPRVAFTMDRPLYLPGAEVRWRAIVRDVTAGSFSVPEVGTKLVARVTQPNGRVVASSDVVVQAFGTVSGSVELPSDGPVGTYTLSLAFADQTFTQPLVVRAYKVPEYRVEVTPAAAVVAPGAEAKARARVTYFFGGPVRDARVTFSLWRRPLEIDASRYEAHAWYLRVLSQDDGGEPSASFQRVGSEGSTVTDQDGNVEIAVTTEAAVGQWEYRLAVTVQDTTGQVVGGSGTFATAERDRFAVVLPQRKAWRTGDTAEVRVVTRDLLHGAVGTTGRLEAQVARTKDGQVSWSTMRDVFVDTGLTGEAVVKIPLDEAGDVRLRFSGTDASGDPVIAIAAVVVTGERHDDDKEARLVLDRKVYKAGDTARVHVSVPKLRGPILLTFEAERVLRYRLVTPTERSGVLEIPVEADLAPNAVVAIAVPGTTEFLTASDELVVLRYLDITVKPEKASAMPGEKVAIVIETKDQSGNAVAASVAVKAVDAALLELGGRSDADPRFVFNQDFREHLVRTSSTWGFRWEGPMTFLDRDLLDIQREEELGRVTLNLQQQAQSGALSLGSVLFMSPDLNLNPSGVGGGIESFAGTVFAEDGLSAEGRRLVEQAKNKESSTRNHFFGATPAKPGSIALLDDVANSADGAGSGKGRPDSSEASRWSLASGAFFSERNGREDLRAQSEILFDRAFFGLLAGHGGDTVAATLLEEPTLRERFVEVAGWWPMVVTNAEGQARVTLELPDNLTTWSLTGSGATSDTAVGVGGTTLLARKDVILRVERPRFLSSRDSVRLPAVLHNDTAEAHDFSVSVDCRSGALLESRGMGEQSFRLAAGERRTLGFQFMATGAGLATLSGKARSTGPSDGLEVPLRIVPFGADWRQVVTGGPNGELTAKIAIDHDVVPGSQNYRVIVTAPGGELIAATARLSAYPYGCLEQTMNRFIPAMVLHRVLGEAGLPDSMDGAALRRAVVDGLRALHSFQADDGGFAYWPGARESHAFATAIGLSSLGKALDAGYEVQSDLLSSVRETAERMARDAALDPEVRVALALAVAQCGGRDPETVNAILRKRSSLTTVGLARLLLLVRESGLGHLASSVESLLLRTASREVVIGDWPLSSFEGDAFKLLALTETDGPRPVRDALAKSLRDRIANEGSTKALAVAIEALAVHGAEETRLLSGGEVTISVDGKEVATARVLERSRVEGLTLPASALGRGEHVVRVSTTGSNLSTRLVLDHVVAADSVAAEGNLLVVERRVVPYRHPDAVAPSYRPGFDVVRPESRPKPVAPPSLSHAVVGDRVTVEITLTAREAVSYVALEDPQLAGFEILEDGVRGPVDRHERRADRLIFFKDRLAKDETITITYPCYAVHVGRFFGRAARAEEMYAPEVFGRSPSLEFEVVPDASLMARREAPKPTPDELYGRGTSAFAKGEFAEAIEALKDLPRQYDLLDGVHDDILSRLLVAQLRTEKWRDAIATEEALRLRNPNAVTLVVDDQLRLGRGLRVVEEPELAMPWLESVRRYGFQQELAVSAFLGTVGDIEGRIDRLRDVRWRYAARTLGTLELDLADLLLSQDDATLKGKSTLLPVPHRRRWREAMDVLLGAAAFRPGEPIAEEALLRRVRTFEALGDEAQVERDGRLSIAAFPKARAQDEVLDKMAHAAFGQARYADAAKAAQGVWDYHWPLEAEPGIAPTLSVWRPRAGYLLGKIAHVEGRYEEAVTWYDRVKDQVADARQSYLFFTKAQLELPPVVRVPKGATAIVPLSVKNMTSVTAKVYPVDLLVLFAIKKSFDRLNAAELSGVRPAQQLEVPVTLEKYRAGTVDLDLGVKEPGAYLLAAEGDSQAAGSLILVSDARLTLQRSGGAVRLYFVDAAGKPLKDGRVRIASQGRIVHSGTTDVRGMLSIQDQGFTNVSAVAVKGTDVAVAVEE